MTEIKLRECPFCGVASNDVYDHKEDCYLRNLLKGVSGMEYDLVKLFNTRPLEDKLTAENAKLRELVGELVDDGDRLASWSYPFTTLDDIENGPYCTHCHKSKKLGHDEYCPVSKHSALMSKVKEGGYAE